MLPEALPDDSGLRAHDRRPDAEGRSVSAVVATPNAAPARYPEFGAGRQRQRRSTRTADSAGASHAVSFSGCLLSNRKRLRFSTPSTLSRRTRPMYSITTHQHKAWTGQQSHGRSGRLTFIISTTLRRPAGPFSLPGSVTTHGCGRIGI